MSAPIVEDEFAAVDGAPDVAQPIVAFPTSDLEVMAAKLLALPGSLGSKLEAIERAAIAVTMRNCGHNKSEAARVLGMDRKALERRWQRFNAALRAEDIVRPDEIHVSEHASEHTADHGNDAQASDSQE